MSPQPLAVDPELGPMRLCRTCDEWYPDDSEFWLNWSHRTRSKCCKACHRQHNRESRDRRLARSA